MIDQGDTSIMADGTLSATPCACVRFCSVSPATPSPAVPDERVAAAILRNGRGARFSWIISSARKPANSLRAPPTRVPQRIVLVTPAMRAELAALKEAGFTRYLIKPVRAGSLAARLSTNDGFEAS